ncbi:phage tail tape measure protein [Acuticoccus sp. M5D2P5]|uniref:phage tail tape measure protein n=1 Tax=Acuticoccus kalidii TaxID=2910977 RepID=UPI001F473F57|nr:phage tail tape measure protein [Acuticoccus kalidii]MCF3934455.1 phage tail tape measure protein [Acuticoccus kalidii]
MAVDDEALAESELVADEIADTLTVSAYTFSRVLRTGMRNAVIEGQSLDNVLRRAALSISSASLTTGLRPLTNLLGSGANAISSGLARAFVGAGAAATKAVPFAEGGVIGSPTAFAMGGGRVGLMGEAGREAVLPLARGSDGRLGVALEGGGAGPSVNVTINTPDIESFRRSEAQVSAMLARAVSRGRRGM